MDSSPPLQHTGEGGQQPSTLAHLGRGGMDNPPTPIERRGGQLPTHPVNVLDGKATVNTPASLGVPGWVDNGPPLQQS